MKQILLLGIGLFILICAGGCMDQIVVGEMDAPEEPPWKKEERAGQKPSNPYIAKAISHEKSREYRKAIAMWKIAAEQNPDDKAITERIAQLESNLSATAESHYRKGLSLYKQRRYSEARQTFLAALEEKPDHEKALYYVKVRLNRNIYTPYIVRPGDTLRTVAKKFYENPRRDFLIAWFNDMEAGQMLRAGTELKLPGANVKAAGPEKPETPEETKMQAEPVPEPVHRPAKRYDVAKQLAEAELLFTSGRYREVLGLAGQILRKAPDNQTAKELRDKANFQIAKELADMERFQQAYLTYKKVSPGFPGLSDELDFVRGHLSEQAEIHYRRGVNHFVNEELRNAIQEWEKTLEINPDHPKARKDIENARNLLEKLRQVK